MEIEMQEELRWLHNHSKQNLIPFLVASSTFVIHCSVENDF